MRKLVSVFMIIALFITIPGCNNLAKPESTVSDFMEAAKNFDFDTMKTKINPTNLSNDENINELTTEDDEDQFEKYFMDYLKANAKKISYKIKDTKINDDTAVVTVDFKYVNGGPIIKATIAEYFAKGLSLVFSGIELTEEETSQIIISEMKEQMTVINESFTEKTVDIKCTKVDNQWYIDELSDELLDVVMSNFIAVGKELDDSFTGTSDSYDEGSDAIMEKAAEDNMTIIKKTIGDEIILSTIKLKVNSVEETRTISATYGDPTTAKDDAKFILVSLELTNITNKTFSFPADLIVVDNKDREFNTYSDSVFAIDNNLDYRDLSPSIKESGYLVYELPTDAVSYSLVVGKSGTNEVYKILLK